MEKKTALIIGGGVAGLTAAYELLKTSDIKPIIFEESEFLGGISKTVEFKGNLMDIGGHRFFSKSTRVESWWEEMLPSVEDYDTPKEDVMLVRERVSRIFYLKKFFDYPLKLNISTLRKIGFIRLVKIGFSYTKSMIFPIRDESNLEAFFINRFGKELYKTFFKDYTEKVWGVPCTEIGSEWGAQRIKGISIREVIWHAFKSMAKTDKDENQKDVETSLIERFLYPKYGVGQMWNTTGKRVVELGGEIKMGYKVIGVEVEENVVTALRVLNTKTKEEAVVKGDYVLSTMPVKDLVKGLNTEIPERVNIIAANLKYRDFISIGVLLKSLSLSGEKDNDIRDNWIYIQERDVKMGRIQLFNNWSKYMVNDPNNIWIGLEYFCQEGDEFWSLSDEKLLEFAKSELVKMNAISPDEFIDGKVVRQQKAYPSYIGSYKDFDEVKDYFNQYENLYLMGRNGMHRYNNMDHSMLSAIMSVENITSNIKDKSNLWAINTENDYHEEK